MDINEVLGIDISDPHMRSAIDMEEQRSSLVRKLAAIRVDNDLTQKAVSDLLHVSKQAVTQFEADNRDIKLSTLIRYAMAVGAHIDIQVEPVQQFYRAEIEQGSLNRPQETGWSMSEFSWPLHGFTPSESETPLSQLLSSPDTKQFEGKFEGKMSHYG